MIVLYNTVYIFNVRINIQYMYMVGKYNIYLYELSIQVEKRAFGEIV
jgi:hypothetical protein